jgi:serine/threonine protein kinase
MNRVCYRVLMSGVFFFIIIILNMCVLISLVIIRFPDHRAYRRTCAGRPGETGALSQFASATAPAAAAAAATATAAAFTCFGSVPVPAVDLVDDDYGPLVRLPSNASVSSPPAASPELLPDEVAASLHAALGGGAAPTLSQASVAQLTEQFAHEITGRFETSTPSITPVGLPVLRRRVYTGVFWDPFDRRYVRVAVCQLQVPQPLANSSAAFRRDATRYITTELEVVSRINHPNVARLLAVSHDWDGSQLQAYLVYEYQTDQSLAIYLTDNDKAARLTWTVSTISNSIWISVSSANSVAFSVLLLIYFLFYFQERLRVLRKIATALQHMHGQASPVYHRDVKASNVVLSLLLQPKLIGCGLAQVEAAEPGSAARGMAFSAHSHERTLEADVRAFGGLVADVLVGRTSSAPRTLDALMGEPVDRRAGSWPAVVVDELHSLVASCWSSAAGENKSTMAQILSTLNAIEARHCSPETSRSTTMRQYDRMVQYQLSLAAAARRVLPRSVSSRLAGPSFTCRSCFDENIVAGNGILCASQDGESHFYCNACFQICVLSQIDRSDPYSFRRFAERGAHIVCPSCLPTVTPYGDAAAVAKLDGPTQELFRHAVEQIPANASRPSSVKKPSPNQSSAVSQHRTHIADEILTNRCPKCKIAFFDWNKYACQFI